MTIAQSVKEKGFEKTALEVFEFTWNNNELYRAYCELLQIKKEKVSKIEDIPFLPIQFYKKHHVQTGNSKCDLIFESSGTTVKNKRSKHFVSDLNLYNESLLDAFKMFFGRPEDFIILALLPAYLDRQNSSLIYMVNELMKCSNRPENTFYNTNVDQLINDLSTIGDQPIILFGVTFALLDLAEKSAFELPNLTIVETGGMKGRKKEMIRKELHEILSKSFNQSRICSEYGMTELLSQAYAIDGVNFNTPPWMKILIRDVNDPFSILNEGKTGGINIIDLANKHSCAFIETEDLGKLNSDNSFEVLGRYDQSDIRGCNLLWN